jgi:hypothetical protein
VPLETLFGRSRPQGVPTGLTVLIQVTSRAIRRWAGSRPRPRHLGSSARWPRVQDRGFVVLAYGRSKSTASVWHPRLASPLDQQRWVNQCPPSSASTKHSDIRLSPGQCLQVGRSGSSLELLSAQRVDQPLRKVTPNYIRTVRHFSLMLAPVLSFHAWPALPLGGTLATPYQLIPPSVRQTHPPLLI